jgi:hypothetical protein
MVLFNTTMFYDSYRWFDMNYANIYENYSIIKGAPICYKFDVSTYYINDKTELVR